ncbi:MAG: aminomethyl-transferring glycine dehydrogenase subunit GcvPA [Candidatus Margulisiibacteriota bacterium]|nr:aminomethyl-transferring glycine dehydrogenase subunit GcvPA [Candidatus Margulisiibacteriota bacterium]
MRYVPHTEKDKKEMLSSIGKSAINELFSDLPDKVALKNLPPLPKPLSEPELLKELGDASKKNKLASPFLGGGSYNHFIPSVVGHIVGRSEFYTAYTPYQAEASQGILQAIYEYQTMICELTGMEVANASMYDGATAMSEAAMLACRYKGKEEIVVSSSVHPEYRKVLKTYADGTSLNIKEVPFDEKTGLTKDPSAYISGQTACLIIQQPNFFGCIEDIRKFDPLLIVSVDPVSLGILKAPGEYGADIVVGEGQSLGNPQSFGGPGLGIFAAKKELMRMVPGRIVGKTTDAQGKQAFCLTLQTREQHIRRERATSNICSNEALAALAAAAYFSVMGKQGLRKVAELCLQKSNYLKKRLKDKVLYSAPTFKEFMVKGRANPVCVTELVEKDQLDAVVKELT